MYYKSVIRSIQYYKVNAVIKALILSDFLIWSSYQLIAPIFAIFVTDRIQASIEIVGITAAIYLVTRSIMEIPVSIIIDKSKSERDDLFTALVGTLIAAGVYISYIFITEVWQLYMLQVILGLGAGLAFPGWSALFTHHIDRKAAGFEWSLYDVTLGIGMAATAALGGFIADKFGFNTLFFIVGAFVACGSLILLAIRHKIIDDKPKK